MTTFAADASVYNVANPKPAAVSNFINTSSFATRFARGRIQYVDIKFTLPKAIMDAMTRAQLGFANEVQEEYRRNGKEVDKEMHHALAEVMRRRRGVPLTSEQKVRRCGGGESWIDCLALYN